MNWLVGGLIVGPILYILVTLYTPRLNSVEDYQFGERKLNPSDVVDASIMYGLQIAAISLFATWGFLYGFATLVVPLFWALGYLLFSWALSDNFLTKFASENQFRTLHGFLADHGKVRSVRLTAAALTLVGLAGPAMVEAFTVGRSIATAVPAFGATGGVGLALAFLAVSLIYMTRSGFPGVVRLNQIQMTLGYGGFCVAITGSMLLFIDRVSPSAVFWLSITGLVVTIVIAALKVRHDWLTHQYVAKMAAGTAPRQTLDLLGLSAVLLAVGAFAVSTVVSLSGVRGDIAEGLPSFYGSSESYGFTALATLSLFMANAFYQFVDVTQWQRLLSLAVDKGHLAETARMLRSNVLTGGLCSALTWVIAILFGLFLRSLFPDPDADAYGLLPAFVGILVENSAGWGGPVLLITVAALLAIMFSTLDAIVAATAFTVQEDLLGVESGKTSLTLARTVTVCVVLLQLGFYLAVGAVAADRVDAILYICWSFQLAMLPVVVGLLLGRAGSYLARIASMLAGCVGALLPLILGVADRAYEVSPTAAIVCAVVVYLLFGGTKRQAKVVI